jgi:hypothetical protein
MRRPSSHDVLLCAQQPPLCRLRLQWGLKHYWDALLDADLECDALGWQYVAGCMAGEAAAGAAPAWLPCQALGGLSSAPPLALLCSAALAPRRPCSARLPAP